MYLYETPRNAACNGVVDAIDLGSGSPNGTLLICTAGFAIVLATINFSNPAFGDASSGVATANAMATATVVADGTAAIAVIYNRCGDDQISQLSVGTSGSDINLSSLNLSTGDKIQITSATVTMPQS